MGMQRTRQQILENLKRHGGATVDKLATELGLVPVTVRAHLAVLEKEGYIGGAEERHGKAGRPHILYSLTDRGEELFPKSYDRLAVQLLDTLKGLDGEGKVSLLLQEMARRVAAEKVGRMVGKGFPEKLEEALHILEEQGCLSEWEKTPEGYVIRVYNCPYPKVLERHPQLCILELELLKNLFDVPVEGLNVREHPATVCSYLVRTS